MPSHKPYPEYLATLAENTQEYIARLEAENEQLQTEKGIVETQRDATRQKDNVKLVSSLEAENKRLQEEVGFWAGEGQQERPEMLEWRSLIGIAGPEATARIKQLAEMFRIEVEDAPELKERLTNKDKEIERLQSEVERLNIELANWEATQ